MNFNKCAICAPSAWEFSHFLGSNIILEQLPASLSPIIVLHHLFIMCKTNHFITTIFATVGSKILLVTMEMSCQKKKVCI